MIDSGDIFLGNTPVKERAFLASVLEKVKPNYKKLIVPCAGKFAGVEAAIHAGWKPENIVASDTSLFSTILAYYVSDLPLKLLNIKYPEWEDRLDLSDHPTMMYALKLAVLSHRSKRYYDLLLVRDMERRADAHIASLKSGMDTMKERIGGFEYQIKDMFDHLEETLDDPENVIWVNPPGYYKGYVKLYNVGDKVTWDDPLYHEFNPKYDHNRLRLLFEDKAALTLRYKYQFLDELEVHEAVYGGERTRFRVDYILTNRPDEIKEYIVRVALPRKVMETKPIHAPILHEGCEITPESVISVKATSTEHAIYYRDLFAHKLGSTQGEENFLLFIDGYVFGVVGMSLARVNRRLTSEETESLFAEEIYGFNVTLNRYSRLNRLLMMIITTKEFLNILGKGMLKPEGLATACLAQYPEVKINRGILKLVSREQMKNGMYKLRYKTLAKDKTYAEVLQEWLAKHGQTSLSHSETI